MGAAHSEDDNRVSSFFIRSAQGVPTAAGIIFSLSCALIEEQKSLYAWVMTCFILIHSTTHMFFHKATKERVHVFSKGNWSCLAV